MRLNIYKGVAVVIVSVFVTANSFATDFLVVSSTSGKPTAGGQVNHTMSVNLQEREELRLIDKDTGETQVLIGPYSGLIGQYRASCSSSSQITLPCDAPKRSKPVGATRSLKTGDTK